MDTPTAEQIRGWSKVEFGDLDFDEAGDPSPPDQLDIWLNQAVYEFETLTSITLADVDDSDPEEKRVGAIQRCIQMMVEWWALAEQEETIETTSDFDLIKAFGAGNYNETRRGPYETRAMLHPSPRIDRMLHLLRDGGLGLTSDVPAIGTDDPRWDVARDIIDAGRLRVLTPFGPAMAPWW